MANRDWTGNAKTAFTTLGASNHSKGEREEHDYYATDPKAVELLLEVEEFDANIWEPACGEGHIAEVLKRHDYNVYASDLVSRGYGVGGVDFLQKEGCFNGDIITNPPYKYAQQFVEKALELIPEGNKVAMFLKLQFLEGKARRKLFDKHPPCRVWVSSSRLRCAKNGDFESAKNSNAIAYAWFAWSKGFRGDTVVKWFN